MENGKEGQTPKERTSRGVSYEQKGEEVDDDDDGNVRSWIVFELRAPVVQTENGSRRMAGMT